MLSAWSSAIAINARSLDDRVGRQAASPWPMYPRPRCAIAPHSPRALATMTRRWPFSRKTKNDHEASGSSSAARRCMPPPQLPRMTPTCVAPSPRVPLRQSASKPPWDRVYIRVRQAQRLYTRGQPVPWWDVNLLRAVAPQQPSCASAAGFVGRARTRPGDSPAPSPASSGPRCDPSYDIASPN
jgi:hypothetical protein